MNKKYVGKCIYFLCIVGILALVIPAAFGAGYTYLCEDDFSFEAGANDWAEIMGSDLGGAFSRASSYYMTNQGTYFFNFFIHLLRVYTRFGLPGFHFYMILITIAFSAALYYLVYTMFEGKEVSAVMSFIALFSVFGTTDTTNNYKELFLWYTGTLNFIVELLFAFIALSLCIRASRESSGRREILFIVLSAICAFFASGGALEITAASCGLLFAHIIISFDAFMSKKRLFIPFISGFAGAIFNVIAPGNFIRSEEGFTEGHITFFDGIRDTFLCYMDEAGHILFAPSFIILMALTFAAALVYGVKIKRNKCLDIRWLVILLLGAAVLRFITMFPVTYGYHMASLEHMRTTGAYELVARLMYLFEAICIAQFVGERLKSKKGLCASVVVLVSALIAIFAIGGLSDDIKTGYSYAIARDLKHHSIQDAYSTRAYVLSTLELAEEGTDVIIYTPVKPASTAYGMGLNIDCEEFVNVSAAGLFHVHTVTVIFTD